MADHDLISAVAYPSAAPTPEEMAAFDALPPAEQHRLLCKAIEDGRRSGKSDRTMEDLLRAWEAKYGNDRSV